MIWREDVVLLRLPMLRLRFRRPQWEQLRRMRVGVGIYSVVIEIAVVDEPTVRGGHRRWLCCPCGRRTSVLGVACATGNLGCRQCLGWRSRSQSVMSPLVAHTSAGIVTHAEVR
jgi:hypothetical protein